MKPTFEVTGSGRREQWATRLIFLVAGLGMAAWAPLVPYAKDRLGADNGTLGLLLLSLGAGSIIAMPITGILATKFGCRAVIVIASAGIVAFLPLLAIVDTPLLLALALAGFGASVGTVDVAANIQAVVVEKDSGRSMMSGFHGLFSLGGIVGAGGVSLVLANGMPLLTAAAVVCLLLIALVLAAYGGLLPYGSHEQDSAPAFVLPHGIVLLIGLLCFVILLAEGVVLDWSAVFLVATQGVDQASAGIGYTFFAIAMTAGRLLGDRVVPRLGGTRVVVLGSLLAALGYGLVAWSTLPLMTSTGFGLVGLGLSNVVPVFFSAAGRQKAMPPSLAIAAVTTLGYAGILIGPAAIGLLAEVWNLNLAFILVSASLVLVAVVGPIATRLR